MIIKNDEIFGEQEALFPEPLYLEKDEDEDEDDLDDDEDDDLDVEDEVATEEEGEEGEEGKSGGMSVMTMLIIIGVAVIAIGGVIFFLFSGGDEATVEKKKEKSIQVQTKGPAVYINFPHEEIVAILYDKRGVKHHVIMKIVLLTRDSNVKEELEKNSAIIISEYLELVEKEDYETLITYEGKVKLRSKLLGHVKQALPKYQSGIEKVLITKFLMD